jgi:UDP-2-acetamido-2,6-beta-L-arabino-hexul-4-ose reductase
LNIVITGSSGFIAKNLIATLQSIDQHQLFLITRQTSREELKSALQQADFLFHLAGVNRPVNDLEFYEGNVDFTKSILDMLKDLKHYPPILFTSSTQTSKDNSYGKSKQLAEELLLDYAEEFKTDVVIYRLPNVYGKWCKPNYNSVIATFCHNVANQLPIYVDDPSKELTLVYIDNVVDAFVQSMKTKEQHSIMEQHKSLGDIANLIISFRDSSIGNYSVGLNGAFTKTLYSTYISYKPLSNLNSSFIVHENERGSFTEIARNQTFGQFSINVSKPGVIKGNHWHRTKHEKFIVVSGYAIIRVRPLLEDRVVEIAVNEEVFQEVDIPPGTVHHIENIGNKDLITIMWANELYDEKNPDTYPMEVFQ